MKLIQSTQGWLEVNVIEGGVRQILTNLTRRDKFRPFLFPKPAIYMLPTHCILLTSSGDFLPTYHISDQLRRLFLIYSGYFGSIQIFFLTNSVYFLLIQVTTFDQLRPSFYQLFRSVEQLWSYLTKLEPTLGVVTPTPDGLSLCPLVIHEKECATLLH